MVLAEEEEKEPEEAIMNSLQNPQQRSWLEHSMLYLFILHIIFIIIMCIATV